MAEARRSGLPALAPPVPMDEPSTRKTTTAGADDPDVPPALPPKEPRPDKVLPKPKIIFPGPPQAFAMSGPRRPGQSPPHGTANGRSAIHLPQMPEPPRSSERGAALVDGDTRTRSRDAQSRSQTLPLPIAVAEPALAQRADSLASESPASAQAASGEKLAVRTSSRPRAPRSSTGGPGHLSSTPTSLRMIDTAVRVPSPVLPASPTSRPSLPSTPISASPTDSLHPHSYIGSNDGHASPNSYRHQSRARERSPSPSPRSHESPSQYSVMDRPRPKTPEPSLSSVFAPQNGPASRLLAPRPSAPAVLPAFAAAPIFPGPPSSAGKTSVLDRPRPRTPEVLQRLESSPSSVKTATSPREPISRQPDGRTTTPTPIFPSKPRTSVLDRPRPRPRTPRSAAPPEEGIQMSESPVSAPVMNDAVRNEPRSREPSSPLLSPSLDGGSASEPIVADDDTSRSAPEPVLSKPSVLDRPRPKTPDAASWLHGAGRRGPPATGHHSRPNYSIATSGTEFSSSKSGSLDSIGPASGGSGVSVTSPASTVSSFRPSIESASYHQQQQHEAAEPASPLLKLDFDFGSTFSSAETMFGLSDYLQLGDATPKQRSATPIAPLIRSGVVERRSSAEGIAEPAAAPERDPVRSAESEPSTPKRTSSPPPMSTETLSGTPLATYSGASSSPRSVLAVAGAQATDEAGSLETRRTSDASAIADEHTKTGPLLSNSDASPDRPKRKRRKSLASLLSFRSTSHSVDDSYATFESTDPAANHRRTLQEEAVREIGPYSGLANPEREFSSAPPPSRHAPEPIDGAENGPVVTRQRSYNLDASPENPRKRGPGAAFQVISATSSRQPSRNASGSVSSLHTSETDSSDLHSRPSLDFYRLSSRGKSDVYPEKTDSRHQRAPSATLPLGRRLVEKFSRSAATRPTPAGPAQSWSAPLKDHSAEDSTPRPRLGRRRGSFSSLLGFSNGNSEGKRSVSGQSEKSDAPRTLLGMSLPAGRRSEDLLTSGRRGGSEQSAQARHFRGPDSRRSFDVLSERKPRASLGDDDLLVRQGSIRFTPPCSDSDRSSPQIISPSRESTRAGAPPLIAKTDEIETSSRPDPAAIRAAEVPEVPTSPAQTTSGSEDSIDHASGEATVVGATQVRTPSDRPTEEMPDSSQPNLFKDSVSPSTHAVAPIEPAVTVPPQRVTPRRRATPPPVEPIWRQRRFGSQTVQGVPQTSMSSAWMSLEEAIGRWAAPFALS